MSIMSTLLLAHHNENLSLYCSIAIVGAEMSMETWRGAHLEPQVYEASQCLKITN